MKGQWRRPKGPLFIAKDSSLFFFLLSFSPCQRRLCDTFYAKGLKKKGKSASDSAKERERKREQ